MLEQPLGQVEVDGRALEKAQVEDDHVLEHTIQVKLEKQSTTSLL